MSKSILKKNETNNNDVCVAVPPVSVVVDVVNHDEPSVCSVLSNGAITQPQNETSVSLFSQKHYCE